MMKKILCAFLMIFVSGIANANIHIDGKVARKIVLEHIDQEHQVPALQEYNVQLKATGNFTMSAAGLYKVCTAAGWDIATPDGKTKCDNFVKALVAESDYKYYEICGKDKGKSGGKEYCIDNVFYHWYTVADTQVTMLQADGLCKEYIRVNSQKYNNDEIECSNKSRPGTVNPKNDYVKCTSKLNPIYYEFKFDDVVESLDINITASVEKAICEMHGVDYIYATSSQTSTFSRDITFYPPKCKTSDANLCAKINDSMKRFGYNTKIQNKECVISENTIHSESQLRTAFGINNLHFKTGYQLQSYANMRKQLCEYITKNANATITSCECNYNRTQLHKGNGVVDDVLTCYANGQPIDFLFDDLSEHSKTVRQGNMEAFACSVLGGEYQGKTCFTPDKKLCEQIAAATLSECPECAKAYYDETLKSCVLPNATKANEHQKKVNIGLIIGGAVVGAGIIIYTGGTGFAAVAITLETVGAGMEFGAQMHIDGVADEFFMKANNCNDATCAESILQEFFQYLSRMTNDLQDGELNGIESQMVRLIGLLPDDSQFLIDTVAGCYENNGDKFDISKCDNGVWNNDQIIRAVGIGLQFTSVFASVGKWVLGAGRVQKIASKTPRLAEALGKKIPGVKSKIAQKIAKGGKVTRSDGKAIKTLSKVDTGYMGKLKGWKVSKIEIISSYTGEYKFIEETSGKTYRLKHVNDSYDISLQKRAYEILNNNSDIVHTVNVIEEDQAVLKDFATKHNLPQSDNRLWILQEDSPLTYTAGELVDNFDNLFEVVLRRKPITLAEQEEILKVLERLRSNRIRPDDLYKDMLIIREPNGKLRVDIVDFRSGLLINDGFRFYGGDADYVFQKLVAKGGAEAKDVISTLNIVDRSKLSTVDQEFYDLWKAYAPKNQSFDDFKAMSGGDIEKMREMTKGMKAWNKESLLAIEQGDLERLYKTYPEIEYYINTNGFEAAADKFPEVRAILDRSNSRQVVGAVNIKFDEMLDNYIREITKLEKKCVTDPDCFKEATDLKRIRQEMDNTEGFWDYINSSAQGNYSTLDSKYGKKFNTSEKDLGELQKKYEKIIGEKPLTAIDAETEQIDKISTINEAVGGLLGRKELMNMEIEVLEENKRILASTGNIPSPRYGIRGNLLSTESELDEEIRYLKSQVEQIEDMDIQRYSVPTQQSIASEFSLNNLDEVVAERVADFRQIVQENTSIRSKLTSSEWRKMTDNERLNIAQQIIDTYAQKTGAPSVPVKLREPSAGKKWGGQYNHGSKTIYINPNAQFKTPEGMLEVLAHEHNHMIDDLAPNRGALGSQYTYYGEKIYSSKPENGYYEAFTEQSSFKTGYTVEEDFRNYNKTRKTPLTQEEQEEQRKILEEFETYLENKKLGNQ